MNHQRTIPPFYFIVVFWGKTYRDYFLDLLLASLLSPDNIPALDNLSDSRFLICTTTEDWEELQEKPIFQLMKKFIQPVFIKMDFPDPNALKMLVMSHGHKLTSEMAFNAKAIGVFLTPDLILSNGSVAAMQKLAYQGKNVVLCAAIRFEHYGCLKGFQHLNALHTGKPLNLTGRQLMSIALSNLHSETIRYLWDTNHFAETPVSCLWKTPNQLDYIVHTFSWAPLICNYSALTEHSTKTFDEWTLDGDYIYSNFGHQNSDIYIVTDSDEIALVSFTKEEDLHIPATPKAIQNTPVMGTLAKMADVYRLYHNLSIIDPLKQKLFLTTVYFHSNDITTAVKRTALRAKCLLAFSIILNSNRLIKIWLTLNFQLSRISAFRIHASCILALLNKKIKNNTHCSVKSASFLILLLRKFPILLIKFFFLQIKNIFISLLVKPLISPTKSIYHFLCLQIDRTLWLLKALKNRNFKLISYKIKRRFNIWCHSKIVHEYEHNQP